MICRLRSPVAVGVLLTAALNAAPAQVVELSETFAGPVQGTNSWTLASGSWPAINNSDNPQPYTTNGGAWGPGGGLFTSPPGGNYFATDTTATGNANGTVSDWLMTPVLTLHNGDTIQFSTRTRSPEEGPSRMEVRLSSNGASSNVGTTSTSLGDFTNLVGTVNTSLTANAYPTTWTTFTYTVSGLTGTPTGRLAFRTEYPNGGFAGPNGDTVGLASVTYTTPPIITAWTWTGAVSGSWNNSGNWSPSGIPSGNIDNQFTFGAATTTSTANDVPGTMILNKITFTSAAPAYLIGGNGLNFKTNSAGALPQIVTNSNNNAAITAPLTLTNNLTISGSGNLSLNSSVSGAGSLTYNGTGTVTLVNTANTYGGGTVLTSGTIQVAADGALGTGNVTGATLGTLNYTGTTTATRSFTMGYGTLSVAANQTVTFNGSSVSTAFLDGRGTFATNPTNGATFTGVTTEPSVTLAFNSGADTFQSSTLAGPLNVAANIPINTAVTLNSDLIQGAGTLTVGANSQVNFNALRSDGLITLNPGTNGGTTRMTNTGTTPLSLNSGSRTFISTPAQAAVANFAAADLELNGQNVVVTNGLLVNNGRVTDSSAAGNATIIADAGALVKGAGQYDNPVITRNGGRFQAGNSPGAATFGGRFGFSGGAEALSFANTVQGQPLTSNYLWQINNATGTAGPVADANNQVSGWGLIRDVYRNSSREGDFYWDATPADKLLVVLQTLVNPTTVGSDVGQPMANFDPFQSYSWSMVTFAGRYLTQNAAAYPNGPPIDAAALDAATDFDFSKFLNPHPGTFSWNIVLDAGGGGELDLVYTPEALAVPEPGTMGLVGMAGVLGLWRGVRRRRVGRGSGATEGPPTQG